MAVIINSGWTVYGNWYAAGYNYNQLNAWGLNTYGQLGTSNQINYSSPVQVGTSQLWTNIALGLNHTLALQSPGTLWSWGSNSQGQLGVNTSLGYQPNSPVPVLAPTVLLPAQWASLGHTTANGAYNSGIQSNGTLWSWGINNNGQLGLNTTVGVSSPVQIGALSNWTQVTGGSNFQLAIQSPGTLWAWGADGYGQLAQNNTQPYSSPVQIGALTTWTQISAGVNCVVSTQSNGTLWAWGNNNYGQLAQNNQTLVSSPVQVFVPATGVWKTIGKTFGFSQIAIQSNGTLWAWGSNSYGSLGLNTLIAYSSPIQIGALSSWTQVACGYAHTLAIQTNGTLWTWGYNVYGQLGNNSINNLSSPTQVGALSIWTKAACGSYHIGAIQSNGTLWAWGYNGFGQLGTSNTTNYSSPVQVGTLSVWTQIACGYYSTAGIQSNGTLWAWGGNSYGQLGTSNQINYSSPVQVGTLSTWSQVSAGWSQVTAGAGFTTAIQSNGTLWAWGVNSYGQLGINSSGVVISSPVQVGALSVWAQVTAGSATAAIQSNGTLWAWGYNGYGQLGTSNTTNYSSPVQVGTLSTWYQVTMQQWNIGAILQSSGTLYASGLNTFGSLGNNSTTGQSSPVIILSPSPGSWNKISCGSNFTAALQSNGTLWTWGLNDSGQVGLNTTTFNILVATQVGILSYWTQVACNDQHALALQSNGTLWTWGRNQYGQLGLNDLTNRYSPVQIGTNSNWAQVACGYFYSLALQNNGTLWGCGYGVQGELGNNSVTTYSSLIQIGTNSNWAQITGGYHSSAAIQSNGPLWTWGLNGSGQLGINTSTNYSSPIQVVGPKQGTWIQISSTSTSRNSAAIISPGTLWMWGINSYGQLGNNSTTTQSSPIQVGALSTWSQVSSGDRFTTAIQNNGTLWSWGYNPYGNLAQNNTQNYSSPVQVGALSTWTQVSSGLFFNALAIQTPGTLWAWGYNSSGQLGTSNTINYSSPVQIGVLNTWTQISCGDANAAAIQSNGTLWTWGNNSWGQLGVNTAGANSVSSPVQVGALSTWTQVRCGNDYYTIALQSNGTLWGWGNNTYGNLGNNTTTNYSSPVQIGALSTWTQIACGYLNSAGINYT